MWFWVEPAHSERHLGKAWGDTGANRIANWKYPFCRTELEYRLGSCSKVVASQFFCQLSLNMTHLTPLCLTVAKTGRRSFISYVCVCVRMEYCSDHKH